MKNKLLITLTVFKVSQQEFKTLKTGLKKGKSHVQQPFPFINPAYM